MGLLQALGIDWEGLVGFPFSEENLAHVYASPYEQQPLLVKTAIHFHAEMVATVLRIFDNYGERIGLAILNPEQHEWLEQYCNPNNPLDTGRSNLKSQWEFLREYLPPYALGTIEWVAEDERKALFSAKIDEHRKLRNDR